MEVVDTTSGKKYVFVIILTLTVRYLFPCGRWLANDEDDGQISRELICGCKSVPYYCTCVVREAKE